MADSTDGQIIEGIGNEVLFSAAAGAVGVLFLLFHFCKSAPGDAQLQAADAGGLLPADGHAQATDGSGNIGQRDDPGGAAEVAAGARTVDFQDFVSRATDGAVPMQQAAADVASGRYDNNIDGVDVHVQATYADAAGTARQLVERVTRITTVAELKNLMFGESLEERRSVRLFLRGRELDDDVVVGDCDFRGGTVINASVGPIGSRETASRNQRGRDAADEHDLAALFPYMLLALVVAGLSALYLAPHIVWTSPFLLGLGMLMALTFFTWQS